MKRYIRNSISIPDQSELSKLLTEWYGFERIGYNTYQLKLDNSVWLTVMISNSNITIYCDAAEYKYTSVSDALECIDYELEESSSGLSASLVICDKQTVSASITTRNLTSKLVRVKSSNIWSYGANIRDRKSKTGDVLVQFKGKDGGPNGGVYIYYDVPVKLWQRWLVAPSKGSFFWRFIRNAFKYSRLDGNKRGVLPNAIN